MESKKLALLCREVADNKKAENIVVLDVRKLSSITDYFVIVSGTSEPHLRAIARDLTDTLWDKHKLRPRRVEGAAGATWQVLDFFDVIVHIMRSDAREKYKLESLWGDAPQAGKGRAKKWVATKRVATKKTAARARK
jgi:ribosome-associated protein